MFWKLVLAHVIADFILQTRKMANGELKIQNILRHCSIFFIISSIFILNEFSFENLSVILVITLVHGLLDLLKAKFENVLSKEIHWIIFSIDQLLHLLVIVLVLSIFKMETWLLFQDNISKLLESRNWFRASFFFIMVTFGGSYFTAMICKGFNKDSKEDNGLNYAGKYIGILERTIIFISIIAARYEIIGFLITAKSIFRYHTLDNRKLTEYFIIGTFTSFIWVVCLTYLYLKF